MKLTIEIDDDEIRRILAPVLQQQLQPSPEVHGPTRLLTVKDVADRLGVSRSKVYELLYKGEIRSLTIGRTRRISPFALSEFIVGPAEVVPKAEGLSRFMAEGSTASYPRSPRALATSGPVQDTMRAPKVGRAIDLSPQQVPHNSSGSNLTKEEWKETLAGMVEKGWPTDVIDQIRADQAEGVHRVYALTLSDAAMYLGVSRYGVEKLVKTGKLRQFTIAPAYRDEKPEKRIPAKDVLALK